VSLLSKSGVPIESSASSRVFTVVSVALHRAICSCYDRTTTSKIFSNLACPHTAWRMEAVIGGRVPFVAGKRAEAGRARGHESRGHRVVLFRPGHRARDGGVVLVSAVAQWTAAVVGKPETIAILLTESADFGKMPTCLHAVSASSRLYVGLQAFCRRPFWS
jgi:hypothetical protein